jgi:adenylate cyclase
VTEQLTSKLAVILHADIVGSTALVQRDERRAHECITNAFKRFSQTIQEYGGQVHEIRGDALLAEFARASDAVCASLAFQQGNAVHNKTLKDDIAPEVRVGVALGEVVIADKTITGAGVVLAQRIEQLCQPGGVHITEAIREALPDRLPIDSENLGKQDLKGFEKSVRVYAVSLQTNTEIPPSELQQVVTQKRRPLIFGSAAILVAIVVSLVWLKPWQPDVALASVERMAFPLPEKPSIVVLPFNNLSGDPEHEVFVDGLSGDIITDLIRYPGFFVIAHHSSFAYKNKLVKTQQVAEELGVQYLVTGSIERTPKQFRISAQLIDALSGRHLWADRYEVPLEDAIAARDEVVRSIVASFPDQIERAESAKASRRGIDSLSAHELVYRGWYHWRKFTDADNAEAGRLFSKAVEMDPEFDRAYNGLAWFHAHEFEHRWGEDPEASLHLALTNARKSLSIAPGNYSSHWALGILHLYLKEYDQAVAAYGNALELNPNDASLLAGSSELLLYMGNPTEAIERLQRAMRLNPFHPKWFDGFLAAAYFSDRQYDNAIKTTKPLIDLGIPADHIRLAASYAYLGHVDKAKVYAARVLELEPDFSIQRFAKSRSYREKSDLEHYLEGLRMAGLPE